MAGEHYQKKRYDAIKRRIARSKQADIPMDWSKIEYQAKIHPGGTALLNLLRNHAIKNSRGDEARANRETVKKFAEIMKNRGTRTLQEYNHRENQAKNATPL